jgi:hypothetical protein
MNNIFPIFTHLNVLNLQKCMIFEDPVSSQREGNTSDPTQTDFESKERLVLHASLLYQNLILRELC